jgi:integrase
VKKYKFPSDLGYRLRIQSPSHQHRSFRVVKVYQNPPEGSPRFETLDDSAINAVNQALQSTKYTVEKAKEELELFIESHYLSVGVKKFMLVESSENMRLLDAFWEEYLETHRIKDKPSGFGKFRRAVEAVGVLSLKTASKRELQTAIDKAADGNKQRSIATCLHAILRWMKRGDVEFMLSEEESEDVLYLTAAELETILLKIDSDIFKMACRVARGTGMRIGEILYMRGDQIREAARSVFIKYQILRDGSRGLAKCKRSTDPGRSAYVLAEARKVLPQWVMAKKEFTHEQRLSAANTLKNACKQAFPNNPEKWVKFHDLRHSYAIELAQAGVSLLQISQQLGNSERVCQKHYTGYMATSESIDMIEAKVSAMNSIKKNL